MINESFDKEETVSTLSKDQDYSTLFWENLSQAIW